MVWHFEKECVAFFPVLQTAVACEPIVTWSSRRSTLLSCFHVLVLWPKAWYLSCFILHKHSQGTRNKCNLKSSPLINGLSSLIIFVLSKRLCTHILIPLIFLHLLCPIFYIFSEKCLHVYGERNKHAKRMERERESELEELDDYAKNTKLFWKLIFSSASCYYFIVLHTFTATVQKPLLLVSGQSLCCP